MARKYTHRLNARVDSDFINMHSVTTGQLSATRDRPTKRFFGNHMSRTRRNCTLGVLEFERFNLARNCRCSTERKTFGPKMFCDVSDSFGEVPRVEHRPVTATGEVRNTAQQILVAHKSALVSAIGSSLVRPCPSYEIDLS